jgi:acyl-CoA thioester hydrolase
MAFPSFDPSLATSTCLVRVRFADADLMGIVHHANYLPYLEAARVDWLRRRGATYAQWAERGTHLAVVEASVKYRQPARFDDLLTIETKLAELRHASLRFDYTIQRGDTVLTTASTRLACVNAQGGLLRFDDDMMAILLAKESAAGAIQV